MACADLQAGARKPACACCRFNHFGNWHEDVGGLDWTAYLQRRPGALRETIRRRLRKADKTAGAPASSCLTGPQQMDQAADAFEAVYRRSWKEPNPIRPSTSP